MISKEELISLCHSNNKVTWMPSNHYTAPYEDYNLPKYPEPSELGKIDYNPYSVTVDTWKFKPLYDEQKYIDEIKYLKEAVEKLLTIISDLTKAK